MKTVVPIRLNLAWCQIVWKIASAILITPITLTTINVDLWFLIDLLSGLREASTWKPANLIGILLGAWFIWFGNAGISSLWASILLGISWVSKTSWAFLLVLLGLLMGLGLDLCFLEMIGRNIEQFGWDSGPALGELWQFGGPFFVGIITLAGLVRERARGKPVLPRIELSEVS